jgi:hypothetical protein
MGGTCSMHGGDVKYLQLENLKGRDQPEDLGIDGKIILEWIVGR